MEITTFGALVALAIAIIAILKKVPVAYGMIIGALIGGIVGGLSLQETIVVMIEGSSNMSTIILRVLTAGILAGVLIKTNAANSIALGIMNKMGKKNAILAIILSTMILTISGVFIDVAILTVAPIAISVARMTNYSKYAVLLAMVGGGKAGNIMSPNPNTIALSETFQVPLFSLMLIALIPAIIGVVLTSFLVKKISKKGEMIKEDEVVEINNDAMPSFTAAIIGPVSILVILSLRPLFGISIDPMIALPLGALIGTIAMGKLSNFNEYMQEGIKRMMPVAVMLIGTGTLAGIISNSTLATDMINLVAAVGLPEFLLAPMAGMTMSFATASTTAGATLAAESFGTAITASGIQPIFAALMVHTGATVLDHMPHGSFFHSTGGSVSIKTSDRLKLIPYETLIGFTIMLSSIVLFLIVSLII